MRGSKTGRVVEVLLVVVLGRRVATALLGEDVDDDRLVELGRVAEGVLHGLDVVAVDRADVAHPERLEEHRRAHVLPHRGLHRLDALLGLAAHERQAPQQLLQPALAAHVDRVEADPGEALGQVRHRGRVGAAVVVEHDDDLAAAVAEVVEGLVGHAAGHRAVADDGHDVAMVVDAGVAGAGQAVGVGQDRGGVGVLHVVVAALLPARVAGEPAGLAQLREAGLAPGDDLVDVGLVAGVPQDGVEGRLEHPVERERQLDRAEVGAEMPAGVGHGLHDEVTDLAGQLVELGVREPLQVGGLVDGVEDHGRLPSVGRCDVTAGPGLRLAQGAGQAGRPTSAPFVPASPPAAGRGPAAAPPRPCRGLSCASRT